MYEVKDRLINTLTRYPETPVKRKRRGDLNHTAVRDGDVGTGLRGTEDEVLIMP